MTITVSVFSRNNEDKNLKINDVDNFKIGSDGDLAGMLSLFNAEGGIVAVFPRGHWARMSVEKA